MKSPRTFIAAALFAGIINVGFMAYGQIRTNTIIAYALPIKSSRTATGCPGSYVGYANYSYPPTWGWVPATNTTIPTATDGGGRTNTKFEFIGEFGDDGCSTGGGSSLPSSPPSPAYCFTVFFPSNLPTTNYPIVLTGFVSTN